MNEPSNQDFGDTPDSVRDYVQSLEGRIAELKSYLETTTNAVGYWKEREFKANKRIAELERGWISVDDRLPDTSTTYDCHGTVYSESEDVITNLGTGVYISRCENGRKGFYLFDSDPKYNCRKAEPVTHWMPLSEPPKGLSDE